MRKSAGLVAVVAASLLLSGCVTPQPVPPGLTEAEAKNLQAQSDADWWNSMFPGEPQPVIEPIAYRAPGSSRADVNACIEGAGVDGVTVPENDIAYSDVNADAVRRLLYRCELQYPVDLSEPEKLGYLSTAQIGYLYDYYSVRLGPCLMMLGYWVGPAPKRQDFIDSYYHGPYWFPYGAVYSTRPSDDEWERIDFRCPPPPIGPAAH